MSHPKPPIDKSVSTACWVALLLGPFGVFYVNWIGALALVVGGAVLSLITLGMALPVVWMFSVAYAYSKAKEMHQHFLEYSEDEPQH